MKLCLLVGLSVLLVVSEGRRRSSSVHHRRESVPDYENHRSDWEAWKSKYEKSYESASEERLRFGNYVRNLHFISTHRLSGGFGSPGHTLGQNEFMDMSIEEFRETMNGFRAPRGESLAKGHGSTFLEPHHVQIPEAKDWREEGYVTPVKNQGHCGSCWSFSSTGALEGQHFRKTGKLVSLSEQNLVDCSTSFGNNGCNGGLMDQAFQYIKANDGLDTEKSYPYEARDDTCRFKRYDVGAEDSGFVDVQPQGNETALKVALATVGPISIAIDASHQSFMMYNGGVYYEPECSSEQLDHGVLAVGYGTTPEGQDYWIVKNSWGTSWGENGYVRMARNRNNMCGVASQASYPLV